MFKYVASIICFVINTLSEGQEYGLNKQANMELFPYIRDNFAKNQTTNIKEIKLKMKTCSMQQGSKGSLTSVNVWFVSCFDQ